MKKAVPDRPILQGRAGRVEGAEDEAFELRVAGLGTPLGYPGEVRRVEVVRTPHSALFFTEDRVYKLRRPAAFCLLDEEGTEGRRRACEEEVRLNRRLSPNLYLGVVPITRESDGRILLQGRGTVVDWAIEMVRLPAERMLDHLLEHGGVERSELEKLAWLLARFHERAMTGPEINEHGLPSAIMAETRASFGDLRESCARNPGVLDEDEIEFLEERSLGFLEENRELLERRVAMWRIRDGHGALQAGNVCLPDTGVVVFDCEVHGGRRLRFGDVARDLALLVLDLDDRGHAAEAEILVDASARATPDEDLEHLVAFYRLQRALERARAALAIVADTDEPDEPLRRARQLAQLALGYEVDTGLVIVSGADASERAALARYLATRLRAVLLTGDSLLDSGDEGEVPVEHDVARPSLLRVQREYRRLLDAAAAELGSGRAVVIDAPFPRAALRRPFLEAAERAGRGCSIAVVGEMAPDESDACAVNIRAGVPVEEAAHELLGALRAHPCAAQDDELSERPMP